MRLASLMSCSATQGGTQEVENQTSRIYKVCESSGSLLILQVGNRHNSSVVMVAYLQKTL